MKNFTSLFRSLDGTTKTNRKIESLIKYFEVAPDEDKIWAIALLLGKRPRRAVKTTDLRFWAAEMADIPLWLLEESYFVVGDLAETLSLILPAPDTTSDEKLSSWMKTLSTLPHLQDEQKKELIKSSWKKLDQEERFVFNKLITGGFRIGVSHKLMQRALARFLQTDENRLAHRLMGNWTPENTTFSELLLNEQRKDLLSLPYPFFLSYPLEQEPEALGLPAEWQLEFKWDGIRGQLIVRQDQLFIWSRGEELITDRFPEFEPLIHLLPNGTVLDGEILAFSEDRPLDFSVLQTRIGRKTLSKKILEEAPVVIIAYDLLEWEGKDIRENPLQERRKILENLVERINHPSLRLSPTIKVDSWDKAAEFREKAREEKAEGLMVKKLNSPYLSGRKRGSWWKWKIDPYNIDAVLIYAMRGHGRRANLYTDYTFGIWENDLLVPFTKAYSGLTDEELKEVDRFVKKNTIERFGPVRSVKPELVFELAFEGIAKSNRHKSGVALRFPRILRWRRDKKPSEANRLEDLKAMLPKD